MCAENSGGAHSLWFKETKEKLRESQGVFLYFIAIVVKVIVYYYTFGNKLHFLESSLTLQQTCKHLL